MKFVYAIIKYFCLKTSKKIIFLPQKQSEDYIFRNISFTTFLEIGILNSSKKVKKGNVQFKIIFKASLFSFDSLINHSKKTIPFFIGLPGFCNKKFMANQATGMFSGIYEWQSFDDANNYAKSYALTAMKMVSKPLPIYFEIIDIATNRVLKSEII